MNVSGSLHEKVTDLEKAQCQHVPCLQNRFPAYLAFNVTPLGPFKDILRKKLTNIFEIGVNVCVLNLYLKWNDM